MALPKAVGYIRVSTTEQIAGFGLNMQESAIIAYCRANKIKLVAVYRDEGQEPAATAWRPASGWPRRWPC